MAIKYKVIEKGQPGVVGGGVNYRTGARILKAMQDAGFKKTE